MSRFRIDEKIRRLEGYLSRNPEDIDMSLDLAEAYFQKSYYMDEEKRFLEKAIEISREVLKRWPDIPRAHNIIGNSLYGMNRLSEAEKHYAVVLKIDPQNPISFVGLGNIARARGEFRRARSFYLKAISVNSCIWQAHYNLGCAFMEEARNLPPERRTLFYFHKGIYHIVKAIQAGPFEGFLPEILINLGELLFKSGRFEESKRVFLKLKSIQRLTPYANYYLGLSNYSLGKYYNALENFRAFLMHNPESSLCLTKIALCHLELKNYGEARRTCDEALKFDPDNLLASFIASSTFLEEGNTEEACRRFEAILRDSPDYIPAFVELVKLKVRNRDFDFIKDLLYREIEGFDTPGYPEGGRTYHKGRKGIRREKIGVIIEECVQSPSREKAFSLLFSALKRVGNDSLAFEIFEALQKVMREFKIEEVSRRLAAPLSNMDDNLIRDTIQLSPYLSARTLMSSFSQDEKNFRIAALNRFHRDEGRGNFALEMEALKKEFLTLQAAILRALGHRKGEGTERFLLKYLDSEEEELRKSALLSLAYHGNERAVDLLIREMDRLEGEERARVSRVVEDGLRVASSRKKVVRIDGDNGRGSKGGDDRITLMEGVEASPDRPAADTGHHCHLCKRGGEGVSKLMVHSSISICLDCISSLVEKARKGRLERAEKDGDSCSLCKKSAMETPKTYWISEDITFCKGCIELCAYTLEREEVNSFLVEFF